MKELIKSKLKLRTDTCKYSEYENCVNDLIYHQTVRLMDNYIQHRNVTCLEHSIYVSYKSFRICKMLGFDYRSAARGGLLHDLFLYDWHVSKPNRGLHAFYHPGIALKNSDKVFCLNDIERDIIKKHMWPLTVKLPKFKESFIVSSVDKYCTVMEFLGLMQKSLKMNFLKNVIS